MIDLINSINLLWLEWSLFSGLVFTFGILVLNYSDMIPSIFHRIVKYGKSANNSKQSIEEKLRKLWDIFEIPKRYFFHFYIFALLSYLYLATAASIVYFNADIYPNETNKLRHTNSVKYLLDKFATSARQATSKYQYHSFFEFKE